MAPWATKQKLSAPLPVARSECTIRPRSIAAGCAAMREYASHFNSITGIVRAEPHSTSAIIEMNDTMCDGKRTHR